MDFWSFNWSDVATVIGVLVSLIGLGWAIKEARGARSASQSAQRAANEVRNQVAHQLQTTDLVRAIEFIQRMKALHDNERWEATMELYQPLRNMLSDIIARCPPNRAEFRGKLSTARIIVGDMEKVVRRRANGTISARYRSNMNESLINMQSDLEELASAMGFGDPQGETQ